MKTKWEWYIKAPFDSDNINSGTLMAKTSTEAKRLATKASNTGHWKKKWCHDGYLYYKMLGDGRIYEPSWKNMSNKESVSRTLYLREVYIPKEPTS